MSNTERKEFAALAEIASKTGLIYRPLDLVSLICDTE